MGCAFILSYCGGYKKLTAQTEALFRNKWRLTEVQGMQVADSLRSSFEFTPGKISGSTGCNWLSAGFVAGKDQAVLFSPEAPVKRDCQNENAATLEARFLDALSKSSRWDIRDDELWLSDGVNTLIKLKSM
jgi:heat shock protein HslJ